MNHPPGKSRNPEEEAKPVAPPPDRGISRWKLALGAASLFFFVVGVKRSFRTDDGREILQSDADLLDEQRELASRTEAGPAGSRSGGPGSRSGGRTESKSRAGRETEAASRSARTTEPRSRSARKSKPGSSSSTMMGEPGARAGTTSEPTSEGRGRQSRTSRPRASDPDERQRR